MLVLIGAIAAFAVSGFGASSAEGYDMLFNFAYLVSAFPEDDTTGTYTIISTVYSLLAPLGMAIGFCYIIIEILEIITRSGGGNVTLQSLFIPLVKLAVIFLLIENGIDIIRYVFGLSNGFVEYINSAVSDVTVESEEELDISDVNGAFAKVLFVFLPAFLSVISQIIACFLLGMQVMAIKLEVCIRAMFFPLAAANIANTGPGGGGGIRYLKGFIGDIFVLGTVLCTVKLVYVLVQDIGVSTFLEDLGTSDTGAALFTTIFVLLYQGFFGPFAVVGAVATVKSVVKEAVS